MKRQISILILGLLLALPFALAANVSAGEVIALNQDLALQERSHCEELMSEYMVEGVNIPSALPFSNEVFHVIIGDQVYASLELTDKTVTSFSCSQEGVATMTARITSEEVIDTILASEDLLQAYQDARNNDEIILEGTGFIRKAKLILINAGIAVISIFQ